MKRTILITGLTLTAAINSYAQSTLNAMGNTTSIGGNEFSWSVGEMTMVSTFTTPGIIITQGLLQPSGTDVNAVNDNLLRKRLSVFPNPATSVVNIEYSCESEGKLSYRLIDLSGKVISDQEIAVRPGTVKGQVAVAGLACATYMLEIIVNTDKEQSQQTIFQVQKLK